MATIHKTIINARAKLNLSLCVDGKISDSFHGVRSLICPIELNDTIEIEILSASQKQVKIFPIETDGLNISEVELDVLNSEKNLIFRAAKLLLSRQEEDYQINIKLTKRIPTQAGLGGGSADAAAVLRALSKFFYKNYKLNQHLIDIASELGSDVVSQLFGEIIFCYGRGEKFSHLKIHPSSDFITFLKSMKLVLLKPEVGVETGWAYKTLNKQEYSETDLRIGKDWGFESAGLAILDFEFDSNFVAKASTVDLFCNDFEVSICERVPEVSFAFEKLSQLGAIKVMLAGSGSCVFGIFSNHFAVDRVIAPLKQQLGQSWFVKESRFLPLSIN